MSPEEVSIFSDGPGNLRGCAMKSGKYTVSLDADAAVALHLGRLTELQCRAFTNPEALFADAARLSPIAIFTDVHVMAKGDGIGCLPKLRAQWPSAAILVVTAEPDPEWVGVALARGAHDYVRKPVVAEELLARLKARLCEVKVRQSGECLEVGGGLLYWRNRYLDGPSGRTYLSPLQTELLRVLVESQGMTLDKNVIKMRVWGKIAVSDNALDRRLSELRRILGDSGLAMQIVSEYGKGVALRNVHQPRQNLTRKFA